MRARGVRGNAKKDPGPTGQLVGCAAGHRVLGTGSGGRIRTSDLWVMSPTSCHCSTPRHGGRAAARRLRRPAAAGPGPGPRLVRARGVPATASPPTGSPPQYSPALPRVTTGFGMGPGGSRALSATDTPHAPTSSGQDLLLLLCLLLGLAAGAEPWHRPLDSTAPTTKIRCPGLPAGAIPP